MGNYFGQFRRGKNKDEEYSQEQGHLEYMVSVFSQNNGNINLILTNMETIVNKRKINKQKMIQYLDHLISKFDKFIIDNKLALQPIIGHDDGYDDVVKEILENTIQEKAKIEQINQNIKVYTLQKELYEKLKSKLAELDKPPPPPPAKKEYSQIELRF